eukprot:14275814-Alexandrium_andersonii.AAC.1
MSARNKIQPNCRSVKSDGHDHASNPAHEQPSQTRAQAPTPWPAWNPCAHPCQSACPRGRRARALRP